MAAPKPSKPGAPVVPTTENGTPVDLRKLDGGTEFQHEIAPQMQAGFLRRDSSGKLYYIDDTSYESMIKLQRYELLTKYGSKIVAADATSAAAKAYSFDTDVYIHFVTHSNTNRAPKFKVTYNDGTTDADIREGVANDNIAIQTAIVNAAGYVATAPGAILTGIFLPAGHTLTVTDANFVAADVMRAEIVYTVLA